MTDTKFRLEPLLKKQPEVALLLQTANLRALEAAKHQAVAAQRMASTSQFLVAVASGNAGSDDKALEKRLAYAREHGADNPHNYTRGMLRIDLSLDEHRIKVRSAKLAGVSRVLVTDLRGAKLDTLPIPIIVTATSVAGRGLVTRDNAGVVRASGAWPIHESSDPEANKVELGRELLDRLLSRSLHDWGVVIQHDDAGDHREQAP